MMNQFNYDNARHEEQKAVMAQIEADGVCSFCLENMPKYHKHPIEKTDEHWYVTKNAWPYDNTAHHFLIVPITHVTDTAELSPEAWAELQSMHKWIVETYNIQNGTLMLRTGDMSKSGSSVLHLHAHFIVAADADVPVITRVG